MMLRPNSVKVQLTPENLTDEQKLLIEKIAANSTFNVDGKKIVVGKWVGLDGGFLRRARETGSLHYGPHPDLWPLFGELKNQQDEVAWLINKQVIQTGVDKGLPFEYTLDGILTKDIPQEKDVIEMLFEGASDLEIMDELEITYIAIRWKELRELKIAGYKFAFDKDNNSFLISLLKQECKNE